MPRSSNTTLGVLDKVTDGAVTHLIDELVDQGLSADRISRRIEDEFDIIVSRESVRRWINANRTTVA